MKSKASYLQVGVQGALLVIAPLSFLLLPSKGAISAFPLVLAVISVCACILCALFFFKAPGVAKISGVVSVSSCYFAAWTHVIQSPFVALSATVLYISVLFSLVDSGVGRAQISGSQQRAWWGLFMVPFLVLIWVLLGCSFDDYSFSAISISVFTALFLHFVWTLERRSVFFIMAAVANIFLFGFSVVFGSINAVSGVALFVAAAALASFPANTGLSIHKKEHWWEILLNRPARIMLTTFSGLCVAGAFLLSLPVSTNSGAIDFVDAVFTSVSAVCVTGLIVLDTPNYFTGFGQFCILLLIQLGGLGIMSITTVALHAIGRRLSLKQERLLTSLTDTDHSDLIHSLTIILKFTFLVEALGAVLLTLSFYNLGDGLKTALWKGVFTSISAFCNAGFALQSDSLVSYQTNPFILHVVALLIIFGGMAPAASLLAVKWLRGKPVPIAVRIALVTTVILLVMGTFFMMAFEWNGVLSGLSLWDKIHNAWFQSVTLRTAGFNSVDMAAIVNPTFIVMLFYMFIGGSPGGTAGGVKTTTVGILALTFFANITNKHSVVIQNKRLHPSTVYRAVTIIISGIIIWFFVVLMLEVTQQIASRDLIFEATSAIGTVGLSTGATSLLDEVGKIIIIIAMFAGRIGPMTMFVLLGDDLAQPASKFPEEKISLT
jgi:trk system potassium uptake protein TrkH